MVNKFCLRSVCFAVYSHCSFLMNDQHMSEQFICRQCGQPGNGKYCTHCGQSLSIHRITMHSILHDVFHFFTHLDKGFPYTLRRLFTTPGKMQLEYIEGDRSKHQKPFSMFFISVTIAALVYYWINVLLKRYHHVSSDEEIKFFNHYLVLLQTLLLPVYTLFLYLIFHRSGYNYAEIGVLQLYTFSIVLMGAAVLQLTRFAMPALETRYVEVPLIVLYATITNLNFFSRLKRWVVIVNSIIVTGASFAIAAVVQDSFVAIFIK